MKYDRRKIMKRSWQLVKKSFISISEALKQAWKEAKSVVFEIKRGKSYSVKKWFADKIAQEVRRNIVVCDIYGILKETEKAIYAMVYLGARYGKPMWIPKSVLIETEVGFDENCFYHYEVLFFESFKSMTRSFWIDHKD